MNRVSRQRGMSSLSILVILMLGGLALTCALKLIPLYIEGMTVRGTIDSAIEKKDFDGLSVGQIKTKIGKYFEINRVEGISARDVKIKREKGVTTIDASYEQRVHLMFNIDVVVVFDTLIYELELSNK
jgi:hypothetical protein